MTRQDEVSRQRLNTAKPKSDKKGKRETLKTSWYHEKQCKPSYKRVRLSVKSWSGLCVCVCVGGDENKNHQVKISVQLSLYIHEKKLNQRKHEKIISTSKSFQSFNDL